MTRLCESTLLTPEGLVSGAWNRSHGVGDGQTGGPSIASSARTRSAICQVQTGRRSRKGRARLMPIEGWRPSSVDRQTATGSRPDAVPPTDCAGTLHEPHSRILLAVPPQARPQTPSQAPTRSWRPPQRRNLTAQSSHPSSYPLPLAAIGRFADLAELLKRSLPREVPRLLHPLLQVFT